MGAAVLALALAATGQAQLQRFLPADGRYGELHDQRQLTLPLVQIDKKIMRLAPGGRIYDENNRTIVHGSLPDAAPVLFVQDMNGDIARLYILLPGEIERLKPAPAPKPEPKAKPEAAPQPKS